MSWEPAQFVVIDADGWRVHSDDLRSMGFVFGGPEAALAYIATTELEPALDPPRPDEPLRLFDNYDGGMVIDQTRREMAWFMSDTDWFGPTIMPMRRLYLRVLRHTWPGWRVRWAFGGVQELIAPTDSTSHVLHRAHRTWHSHEVAAVEDPWSELDEIRFPDDQKPEANRIGHYLLLTVRRHDATTRVWALQDGYRATHAAWHGAGLLGRLPRQGWPHARMAIPSAGLHVDVLARRLGVWTTRWVADLPTELRWLWPGWQATFWGDAYERHVEAADGAVELSVCDEGVLARGEGRYAGYHMAQAFVRLTGNVPEPLAELARARVTAAVAAVLAELAGDEPFGA